MSVVRFSSPQLLDAALRTIQAPVNQEERVGGVGADLSRDPGRQPHQRASQRLAQTENTRFKLEMAISMCCLTPRRRSDGSVAKRTPTSAKASLSSSLR